ncbi:MULTISPECIES: hypothetical protein [Promicromonospora]|uniref:Uncharacterized protein n=1 Tax=Promicromonospora vindobonensis TaxID=195748 RepID=A0ABW5VVZ4_9MICO|nr:hypothetical protein [Promicromonospora umidemergens]
MSTHGGATIMSADAEQVPADGRLPVLRQALSNAGTAAAALVDLSAELRQAGVPGLAWDSDYLADQVDALAGAIALLVKAGDEQTGTTGPTDQGEAERPRQAD